MSEPFLMLRVFRTEKPLDKAIFEQALAESMVTAHENGGYAHDQVHLLSDDDLRQA
jgi:hypothetical protein